VFGIVRPCRHRLTAGLFGEWTAHLCGLCLTLRDLHGHRARLVTNYDGLLVSVLTDAQQPAGQHRRLAGPCALRGLRRAEVVSASAAGQQLAAAVSLILAAGKLSDHVADRDGAFARPLVAAAARRAAGRYGAAGTATAAGTGFDAAVLTGALERQVALERAGGRTVLELTEPSETAVAAAFAHTAALAAKPHNAMPLAEAGRFFGRIAHLLDAAGDLAADQAAGAYNPLAATGTDLAQARRHCDEAMLGLRLAVADLDLERPELVAALLGSEVERAIRRTFARHPPGRARRAGLLRGGLPGCPLAAAGPLITGEPVPGPLPGPVPGPRRRGGCCRCDDCCDCCDCCEACDGCSGCDGDCCSC
jgi:Family of unknown function (DUF5685)